MAYQQPKNFQELRQLHEKQNSDMESRGQDLRLAQMLSRALDPGMPKGFRQMGLRQIAQAVGVDPKGERAKEMIGVLSGLDPQSLEGIKRGITEVGLSSQSPGEVTNSVRGILSGAAPPEQLLEMAQAATRPPSLDEEEEEAPAAEMQPPMMLGGPKPTGVAHGERPPAGPLHTPPSVPPQEEVIPPKYKEGEKPRYGLREVTPGLLSVFGMDPNEPRRLQDLQEEGWTVPVKEEEMEKAALETKKSQQGLVSSLSMMSELASLVRGHPEALDLSINLPFGYSIDINPSAFINDLANSTVGIQQVVTGSAPPEEIKSRLMEVHRDLYTNKEYGPHAKELADKISGWSSAKVAEKTKEAAVLNARIRSIIAPLAFQMAAAKGLSLSKDLSDRDVALQMQELGKSASPEAFVAAIGDANQRLYSQFLVATKARFGNSVPVEQLFDERSKKMLEIGGIAPRELTDKIGVTGPGRFAPPEGKIQPASVPALEPTIKGEEAAVARQQETARAEERRETTRAEERHELALASGERAAGEEKRSIERHELALRGEQREIARERRLVAEKRAERIQSMFVEFGRALRSTPVPQVGGGASVPGQQAGAFQVGAIQRRTPPTIPGATRRRGQGG